MVLLVVLAIFTLGIVFGVGFPPEQLSMNGTFQFTPFLMVVSASLACQLSWAFFVSDYSRYMPPATSHRSIILYTAFGAGAGVFAIEAVGAVGAAGDQVMPGFGAVFRGRSGRLIKALWHDGIGLSLYAKRLERGRFIWPATEDGAIALTAGQMSYLLEGIDWRNPQQTWRPTSAG